ncbi:MAG: TRAP transporter large permease subunit, partial [Roseomonas sp.]|nr:TRAP transporter large permease subunit [Roseomonas sp.]
MIGVAETAIGFVLLVGLLFLGLHVATAMFAVAALGAVIYLSPALIDAAGMQFWSAMEDYTLLAIPLYILLGEILVRSGSTDRLYRSLADWLNPLPGGLLHTNVGASAIFSAVSGSSVATAATVATVALPSFRRRRYDERLVLGSIAAGASLGNLIPPGIALIVYGALTNTSVGQLYAAAVIPGAVMTLLFMATIVAIAMAKPDLVRQKEVLDPLLVRLKRLVDLLPPLIIFTIIMGSIYTGWATVTESAALAVVAA